MARKEWEAMVEKASDKEPEYIGSAGLAFAVRLLSRQHAAVVRMDIPYEAITRMEPESSLVLPHNSGDPQGGGA